LLLTSLTDFANEIGDQKPPSAGGQIIIRRSPVSYKLDNNDLSPPPRTGDFVFFAGRAVLALNSGNYRPDGVGPRRRHRQRGVCRSQLKHYRITTTASMQ